MSRGGGGGGGLARLARWGVGGAPPQWPRAVPPGPKEKGADAAKVSRSRPRPSGREPSISFYGRTVGHFASTISPTLGSTSDATHPVLPARCCRILRLPRARPSGWMLPPRAVEARGDPSHLILPLAELPYNVWPNLIPYQWGDHAIPYRGVDRPMTPYPAILSQMGSRGAVPGGQILTRNFVPFCPDWESY